MFVATLPFPVRMLLRATSASAARAQAPGTSGANVSANMHAVTVPETHFLHADTVRHMEIP